MRRITSLSASKPSAGNMAGLPFPLESPVLLLSIDESGDVGNRLPGKTHYVMAGCLVDDRDGFENVARTHLKRERERCAREGYPIPDELKFHSHVRLRDSIITEAEPFVRQVYYVDFSKRKHGWVNKSEGERKSLHRDMIRSLAEAVAKGYMMAEIDIVIDGTTLSNCETLSNEILKAFDGTGVDVRVEVGDSRAVLALQTNDFFVGAIGYKFNHSPKEKRMRGKKVERDKYSKHFAEKTTCAYFKEYSSRTVKSDNRGKPGSCTSPRNQATQTSRGFPTCCDGRLTHIITSAHRYKTVFRRAPRGSPRLLRIRTGRRGGYP